MMTGSYNLSLVALSLAIAIIASYTALDLAKRVSDSAAAPKKAWGWLLAGAVSMGTGIWAMHFIGMLAFRLPIPIAYDVSTTCFSLLIAIGVSAIALFVLRRPEVSTSSLGVGALLMGIGIAAMHYIGMSAMRMLPSIRYDPVLFVLSVLIAIMAALAALWIALRLRGNQSRFAIPAKLASAAVMGVAIAGMHYTGMAAARFAPGSMCLAAASGGLDNNALALLIGCAAMAILSLTLVLSTLDAHFAVRNARLAHSLQLAKDAADVALRANETITAELRAAQSELVTSARQAGMAEIANSVLHNVGNVLNSVNVSADIIRTKVLESKAEGLTQAVRLMQEHAADLGAFLSQDDRGRRLPGYLSKLADTLATERRAVLEELEALRGSIDHIKEIVLTQQSHAGGACLVEPVRVETLLDDAIRMNGDSVAPHRICVVKEFVALPPLLLDKQLVLQILVNLIANAKQATEGRQRPHEIKMRVDVAALAAEPRLRIRVEDNGEGIAPENLTRLFVHGYTTRKGGHGFGLHSSALAAQAMGGTLTAHSDGPDTGAAFTLELPMKVAAGSQ
jgi:NO-binding membrane sensor protein with MHYT domain